MKRPEMAIPQFSNSIAYRKDRSPPDHREREARRPQHVLPTGYNSTGRFRSEGTVHLSELPTDPAVARLEGIAARALDLCNNSQMEATRIARIHLKPRENATIQDLGEALFAIGNELYEQANTLLQAILSNDPDDWFDDSTTAGEAYSAALEHTPYRIVNQAAPEGVGIRPDPKRHIRTTRSIDELFRPAQQSSPRRAALPDYTTPPADMYGADRL